MTSAPSTTSSKRRKLVAIGVVAIVLAGAGGWLLWSQRLPMEWSGKQSFCAEAKIFEVTNQHALTSQQRLAAMRVMRQSSPDGLHDEMQVLVDDLVPESEPHSHVSADEFKEITVRVGEFVERACGVNLPSIRT